LYAAVYRLSPLAITLLFATYTLLVIPAVLLFGPLSDVKGRREVLVVAIVVAALAIGLFALARNVATLFVAQGVQAMAMGALQGSAAPTLTDYDPSNRPRRAAMVASAATLGGAAAGPVLGGVLAQYAAFPLRLSFLVELGVLGIAAVAVLRCIPSRSHREPWRPRRPSVPADIRRRFVIAGISGFVAWAVAGLFLSLVPSFVIHVLHVNNLAIAGAVMAIMLAVSTVTQLLAHRSQPLRIEIAGLCAMAVGVSVLLVAVIEGSLAVLIVASVFAGIGQGLCFMGSLGDVSEVAPPERKGDLVATYYVVIYLATALPAVGVGVMADLFNLSDAFLTFASVIGAICVIGLWALMAEIRTAPTRLVGPRSPT
jgi:MFS family permease